MQTLTSLETATEHRPIGFPFKWGLCQYRLYIWRVRIARRLVCHLLSKCRCGKGGCKRLDVRRQTELHALTGPTRGSDSYSIHLLRACWVWYALAGAAGVYAILRGRSDSASTAMEPGIHISNHQMPVSRRSRAAMVCTRLTRRSYY